MTRPSDVGRAVRRAVKGFPTQERLDRQRATLVDALNRPPSRRRMPILIVGGGLVTASVAIAVFSVQSRGGPDAIEFRIGDTEGVSGQPIAAEKNAAVPIRFADGSTVELQSGGRATVVRATRGHVDVHLRSGRLKARVEPRRSAAWTFEAGQYRVHVVGTELSIAWTPGVGRAVVGVTHGRVRVSGGHLSSDGVMVAAGEELHLDTKAASARMVREPIANEPVPPRQPQEPAVTHRRPSEDWSTLARKGQHGAALLAAKRVGFGRLLRTLDADQLSELADVARFARDSKSAERALDALYSRFPKSPGGRDAAFLLGRLILDRRGPAATAVQWLQRYIESSPNGPFVEEARGRLIVALRRAGRSAKQAAADYLAHHPKGSYAAVARDAVADDE